MQNQKQSRHFDRLLAITLPKTRSNGVDRIRAGFIFKSPGFTKKTEDRIAISYTGRKT